MELLIYHEEAAHSSGKGVKHERKSKFGVSNTEDVWQGDQGT